MAIVYMNDVQIDRYTPTRLVDAYEYSEELESPGDGNTVIVPPVTIGVSVTLEITTIGVGKIQASTTPSSEIIANEASAVWIDWDFGEIAATTQDRTNPISAIRLVNVSGTTRMTLRAQ